MTDVCVPDRAIVWSNGTRFDVLAARDQVNQRVAFDSERLRDVLQLVARSKARAVLELGAAPYLLTASMVSTGYSVTANGLPTPEFAERSTLTLSVNGTDAEIPLVFFDAESSFPLEDESFDLVVAGEIFEHLFRKPWEMVSESWRVLRPGGWLVLSTPNGHSLEVGYRWLRRGTTGMGFNPEAPAARHAREYGVSELVEVVESQGFTTESVRTASYSHIMDGFPGVLGPIKRRLYAGLKRRAEGSGSLLGNRGDTILLSARKAGTPGQPPGFMQYALGDPRTGYNFT